MPANVEQPLLPAEVPVAVVGEQRPDLQYPKEQPFVLQQMDVPRLE